MKVNKSTTREGLKLDATDRLIVQALAKLDGIALGISLGTVFGAVIFLATVVLIFKGGDVIGPNLSLLSQYFFGYEVSYRGSLIGLAYGFVSGFVLGWLIALLRNGVISTYLQILKVKRNMSAVGDYIDHP